MRAKILTFIVANVQMLIRKLVFFGANDIVYYMAIHLLSASEVHIRVPTACPFRTNEAKGVDLQDLISLDRETLQDTNF